VLSGRGLCEELITRPEEFYRLCFVVVCDLETSRIDAPYIYDISHLRVITPSRTKLIFRKCCFIYKLFAHRYRSSYSFCYIDGPFVRVRGSVF
jgi:hypothetical protein